MPFQPDSAHLHSFLDPAADGNWDPFVAALDPEVRWVIGDPERNLITSAGTYNLEGWKTIVAPNLKSRLVDGALKMRIDEVDVVGMKAFVEAYGEATQLNGRPYSQWYCWIFTFDSETGKVVQIKEYLNSALVKEVMETNGPPPK